MTGWQRARLLRVGGFGLVLAALAMIPTSWLEEAPPLCLVRGLLGVECPGCGMTRALSSLAHGELGHALELNRGVVVVAPLLLLAAVRGILAPRRTALGG